MERRDFLKGSVVAGIGIAGTGCSLTGLGTTSDGANRDSRIAPFDLRCESLRNPLGVDEAQPLLSWKLASGEGVRDARQTGYQITAASSRALLDSGTPDLWDTGRVQSAKQLHIPYEGTVLEPGQRAWWQVRVWDDQGNASTSGGPGWWEAGLLANENWTAKWISDGSSHPEDEADFYEDDPAPLFRREFRIDRPVVRARLYAIGLGYGDFRLNGRPVSDHVLDPAWTNFRARINYSCHDVLEHLVEGENAVGAMLGNGWFNPLPLRMWGRINIREHLPLGRPMLRAQLVLEYEDGTRDVVASDSNWKVSAGPIVRNSVYLGETYDARLEQEGWDHAGFDESSWSAATISAHRAGRYQPLGQLLALPMPPIRITRTLAPVSLNEIAPGVWIFDLGQNFAGWARLRVRGPRGTRVTMRMGERLYEDGTLNPMTAVAGQIKRLREDGTSVGGPGAPEVAWQANSYTLKGSDDTEEYTPRFTFHGFRYVEVTGFPGTPTLDAIEGLRLNTDVESAGTFQCSNERLNKIQEAVEWTLLSNLFSVQSDCPAREKFQYGGDIVATSEMALMNFDMGTFYPKAVEDHFDVRREGGWITETAPFVGISAANYAEDAGPIGWGLAYPLLVDQLYRYYGDRRIVERHFGAARQWVDNLERVSDGLIIDRCIGDHESLDPKPIALIATAHFYQAALLVAGFGDILGLPAVQDRYRTLAGQIKAAFVERFLEPGTGTFDSATQAAQATALYMGLVPEEESEAAIRAMTKAVTDTHGGHIAAGIFGTKYLLEMLSITGNADVAYGMVDTPEYPGWGFMLEHGATTIWETWAESDNVYSQNHPMFGSVSEWFYKSLGGIRPEPDAVGFDRFRIEPDTPTGLDWVETSYESSRGTIASRWRRANDSIQFEVEIPVNTAASVRLPGAATVSVSESGRPWPESRVRREDDAAYLSLGSGTYTFSLETA